MKHFHPHTPEKVKWEQDFKYFETLIRQCEGGGFGGKIWGVVDGDGLVIL